jgi:NADH-quinone oxidoreductase subunit A
MGSLLDDYAAVGAIVLAALALAAAMLGINAFMRPRVPAREKGVTYESGVDPVGEGWAQSTIRYYVYAFLYVIFAVDAVFLFPWAVVLAASPAPSRWESSWESSCSAWSTPGGKGC